jgi:dTMP kinase
MAGDQQNNVSEANEIDSNENGRSIGRTISPTGKLIVAEGIDGSGKSTQLHLLDAWLRHLGALVYDTGWNSSELVKEITSKGKKKALLTPTTFSLLHATDFADRYERNVLPLLRAGYFVLADRYIYTAYARDSVRGCNPRWVRNIYNFAIRPSIAFYFDVPVDIGVKRILTGRTKLKYYEAGMDLNLSNDIYESYRIFQSRIIDEYRRMAPKERFHVVDGTLDIEAQQKEMRRLVLPLLPPEIRAIASTELSSQ